MNSRLLLRQKTGIHFCGLAPAPLATYYMWPRRGADLADHGVLAGPCGSLPDLADRDVADRGALAGPWPAPAARGPA